MSVLSKSFKAPLKRHLHYPNFLVFKFRCPFNALRTEFHVLEKSVHLCRKFVVYIEMFSSVLVTMNECIFDYFNQLLSGIALSRENTKYFKSCKKWGVQWGKV